MIGRVFARYMRRMIGADVTVEDGVTVSQEAADAPESEAKPDVTVGMLRTLLRDCSPDSIIVGEFEDYFDSWLGRHCRNVSVIPVMEVKVFHFDVLRLAIPGDEEYLEGYANRTLDIGAPKKVYLRMYFAKERPEPSAENLAQRFTVEQLLDALKGIDDDVSIVACSYTSRDYRGLPTSNEITVSEFAEIREMVADDPGYIAGNMVKDKPLRVRIDIPARTI